MSFRPVRKIAGIGDVFLGTELVPEDVGGVSGYEEFLEATIWHFSLCRDRRSRHQIGSMLISVILDERL
jgi:hypothetical protein